jgi:hypothetical protein
MRIGRYDSVKRRSLWMRDTADLVQLRAGREGDDCLISIAKTPENAALIECLHRAWWSAEEDKASAEDAAADATHDAYMNEVEP